VGPEAIDGIEEGNVYIQSEYKGFTKTKMVSDLRKTADTCDPSLPQNDL
jgi:hypothetical protein